MFRHVFSSKTPANHEVQEDSELNKDSEMTGLIKISGSNEPSRRADVIFVHGLAGHPQNTWHWQDPKDKDYQKDNFWLTWLGADLQDVGIWTFGYSAARLRANGSAIPLFDQASNFLDDLENFGIGERPIVFVTHSMGGLLVKKMLNVMESFLEVESKKAVFQSTKGIVFLSTPHIGSDVARWTEAFASFFTVNVRELIADNDELRRLDEWYRQKVDTLGVKTKVYYETEPTKGIVIVTKSSANPSIRNVQPIAVEADHDSIAKPKTKNNKVYLGVKKFIEECLPPIKFLPPASNLIHQLQANNTSTKMYSQIEVEEAEENLVIGNDNDSYSVKDMESHIKIGTAKKSEIIGNRNRTVQPLSVKFTSQQDIGKAENTKIIGQEFDSL